MVKFWALLLYVSWAHRMFGFFRGLGALGLFLLGVGDSSFLFVPLSNDLLLIALTETRRDVLRTLGQSATAVLSARPDLNRGALPMLRDSINAELARREASQKERAKFEFTDDPDEDWGLLALGSWLLALGSVREADTSWQSRCVR